MAFSPSAPAYAIKAAALAIPRPPSSAAVPIPRRAPVPAVLRCRRARRGAVLVASAALDGAIGENSSLLGDADLRAYLESQITTTGEVATPEQRLAEVDAFFAAGQYSGLPVVDDEGRCVGVVSHKDKAKASNGMESTVGEVMSSPAITLTYEKIVLEAAALMLKEKVHRIPVVNQQQHVIGIVTRTDVFQAMEASNRA